MPLFTGSDNIKSTTQAHLDIEEIKEDLVILKNGSVTLVLETTAVNFDLLSEREQDAKILAFAGLLNSLNFHMQILIRTQRVNMTDYVNLLEEYKRKQISPPLRRQIAIYIHFVKNLTVNNNVLDKRFFIAIAYLAGAAQVIRTSPLKQLFGKEEKITNVDRILERAKVQLYPKRDHVVKQLSRMNISARQLTTDELTRLLYSIYNPDLSQFQKLQIRPTEYEAAMVEPAVRGDTKMVNGK